MLAGRLPMSLSFLSSSSCYLDFFISLSSYSFWCFFYVFS